LEELYASAILECIGQKSDCGYFFIDGLTGSAYMGFCLVWQELYFPGKQEIMRGSVRRSLPVPPIHAHAHWLLELDFVGDRSSAGGPWPAGIAPLL
jgi:hypothetical protein